MTRYHWLTKMDVAQLERRAEWVEDRISANEAALALGYNLTARAALNSIQEPKATLRMMERLRFSIAEYKAELADVRELVEIAHNDCHFDPCPSCMEHAKARAESEL